MGYKDYCEYLEWLDEVCAEVYRVTKLGGFMAMVIGTVLFERKHYAVPFNVISMPTKKRNQWRSR